jgi:hypothetical protein
MPAVLRGSACTWWSWTNDGHVGDVSACLLLAIWLWLAKVKIWEMEDTPLARAHDYSPVSVNAERDNSLVRLLLDCTSDAVYSHAGLSSPGDLCSEDGSEPAEVNVCQLDRLTGIAVSQFGFLETPQAG